MTNNNDAIIFIRDTDEELPDHYQAIVNTLVKAIDDMIIDGVEEALNDDEFHPSYEEDEEGEAYINRRIGQVTLAIAKALKGE